MLESIFGFVKNSLNYIHSWVNPSPLPTRLNFTPASMCPPGLSTEQISEWAKTYCQQFQSDTLILWADRQQRLNLIFKKNGEFYYECLPNSKVDVDANGNQVVVDRIADRIRNLDDLNKMMQVSLPLQIQIPSQATLQSLKRKVFLQRRIVTPELVQEITRESEQHTTNLVNCCECVICMDPYSNENPPFSIPSGFFYHRDCILEHFQTQLNDSHGLTDPQSRESIPFNGEYQRLEQLLTKSTAHLSTIDSIMAVKKINTELTESLNILLITNQALEQSNQRLTAQNQQLLRKKTSQNNTLFNGEENEDDIDSNMNGLSDGSDNESDSSQISLSFQPPYLSSLLTTNSKRIAAAPLSDKKLPPKKKLKNH